MRASGMRRIAVVVAGALLAGASLVGCRFGGAPSSEPHDLPTAPATRGTFRVTIEDVGVLRATVSEELRAPNWGTVAKVVADGTTVAAGDPVIWMDTTQMEQELQRLDADLADTDSQMKKQLERMAFQTRSSELDLRVSKAQLDFEQARLASSRKAAEDATRQRGLGLISQDAADKATEALRSAELSAEKARLAHAVKVEEVDSERRQIEVERQQTQRTWAQTRDRRDEVQKQVDRAIMKAPSAGAVFFVKQRFRGSSTERIVRVGDQVGPWIGALAQIPDRAALEVRTQVDEALVSRVQPGLRVDVTVTAVEGLVLKGAVKSIAVLAVSRSQSEGAGFLEEKAGVVEKIVFPVVVSLEGSDPRLQPGMTVGVSYVLDVLENATSVPDEAVFGTPEAAMVFVRDGDAWQERKVRLGPSSNGRVVVAEGLDGNEVVCLGDPRTQA